MHLGASPCLLRRRSLTGSCRRKRNTTSLWTTYRWIVFYKSYFRCLNRIRSFLEDCIYSLPVELHYHIRFLDLVRSMCPVFPLVSRKGFLVTRQQLWCRPNSFSVTIHWFSIFFFVVFCVCTYSRIMFFRKKKTWKEGRFKALLRKKNLFLKQLL